MKKSSFLVNGQNGYEVVIRYWGKAASISYEEYKFPSYEIYADEYADPDNWNTREICKISENALAERAYKCSTFDKLRSLIKNELAIDLLEEAHL